MPAKGRLKNPRRFKYAFRRELIFCGVDLGNTRKHNFHRYKSFFCRKIKCLNIISLKFAIIKLRQ